MKFATAADIAEEYKISISTARRHIKKIKEVFKIDENRLPRKGLVPKKYVNKYFKVDEEIENEKEN